MDYKKISQKRLIFLTKNMVIGIIIIGDSMKNKGFTLVELLAVVVVLAVVSIIAIPITLNIIENARKGALENSARGLMDAANNYYAIHSKEIEDYVDFSIVNGKQTSSEKLSYKGSIDNGYLRLVDANTMALCIDDNKYYVIKNLDSKELELDEGVCSGEYDEDLLGFVPEGNGNYIGTRLNVKAYSSSSDLPSKAKEGSIGVITNIKITDYFLGKKDPSNPKEGMIWIVLNDDSTQSIKTKNSEIGVAHVAQWTNNEWVLKESYIYNDAWEQLTNYSGTEYEWNYEYTGHYEEFTATYSGYYTVELWGASGGDYNTTYVGGNGAYTKGDIYLNNGEKLYIYVGGQGTTTSGWNNGATNNATYGRGGGGATDVRTTPTSSINAYNEIESLRTRIMVASAGGGAGGSSYISGHNGCISVDASLHTFGSHNSYTGKYFVNTVMIDGEGYSWSNKKGNYTGMPNYTDGSTMKSNDGNGYARIKFKKFISMSNDEYATIGANVQNTWIYNYMGYYQEFVAPKAGKYKFELWGAQGGDCSSYLGGRGAYTSGELTLSKGETLYLFVGSAGTTVSGWNNGATNNASYGRGGGGATDIRTVPTEALTQYNGIDSLKTRIMVAAAGGGGECYSGGEHATGGAAGGLTGYDATAAQQAEAGHGATQITGGLGGSNNANYNGQFGRGGNGNATYGASGGSGWYGGGGDGETGGGAGGSSYISGHNGCIGMNIDTTMKTNDSESFTGYKFNNTVMIDGLGYEWKTSKGSQTRMPTHDGATLIFGNDGNGYAKITYIGN